jgi:hypothetical protein
MSCSPLWKVSWGGILLHVSTSSLLRDCGRVFGVSGLIEGAVFGDKLYWRWSALTGLILGPIINRATGLSRLLPDPSLELWSTQPLGRLVTAGILVGMGSRVRCAEKNDVKSHPKGTHALLAIWSQLGSGCTR